MGKVKVNFHGFYMFLPMVSICSGWWFQTFFIFHFIYGMASFPLTNSYFSRCFFNHQPVFLCYNIHPLMLKLRMDRLARMEVDLVRLPRFRPDFFFGRGRGPFDKATAKSERLNLEMRHPTCLEEFIIFNELIHDMILKSSMIYA